MLPREQTCLQEAKDFVLGCPFMEIVQLKTATPITNIDLKEGDTVAIVGKKNEKYRTEKGLRVLVQLTSASNSSTHQ